jgi:hypothetical protein
MDNQSPEYGPSPTNTTEYYLQRIYFQLIENRNLTVTTNDHITSLNSKLGCILWIIIINIILALLGGAIWGGIATGL